MAYPMFPLVSAPASYMPVPVNLVLRLASFTLAHPGEPGGLTGLRRKAPGFSHGDIRRFVFFLVFGSVSSFRFLIR